MRTLQNYRDMVRSYLDVDNVDITDPLIDAWVVEGQVYVLSTHVAWQHLHTTATISAVASTKDYAIALNEVEGIQGPNYELEPLGPNTQDAIFNPAVTDSGDVRYWTVESRSTAGVTTVRLSPTPSASQTFTARGWRQPTLPSASGDQPDLPQDFQHVLDLFVVVRACHQQNDFEQGQILQGAFDREMSTLVARYTGAPRRSVILNRRRRLSSTLHDLRFPFEPPTSP